MLFAASSASPTRQPRVAPPILIPHRFPSGHQRYPLLLRCDKVDVQTIVLVEGTFVLFEPSFSRASLSRLIIIIVGNIGGRCCTPVKRFTFTRVIYFTRIIPFCFCFPLRVHKSTATSAFSRRLSLSRRFSRGPADIHGTKSVVCGIKRHLDEWKTISRVCSYAPINK